MSFKDREGKRTTATKTGQGVVSGIINDELAGVQPIIEAKEKEEVRSKRVNLIVKPSVYVAAQKKCKQLGISFNESVNQFLEKWVEK